jgi:hypothetical protein
MFLDNPSNIHLLLVDADIGFEVAQVLRMLAFNKEVVASIYPLKQIRWDKAAVSRAQKSEAPEQAPLNFIGVPC